MMNSKVERLLKGQGGNYIFPFFWQHGEDEETLRKYMQVIHESNIGAVCVESRPHPDFCGPKWWADMDVILDEARKRGMQVWILDDSHFPTGFANGAMDDQPDELCRQSLCCRTYDCEGLTSLHMGTEEIRHPDPFVPNRVEQHMGNTNNRVFDDDRLLGLYAVRMDGDGGGFKAATQVGCANAAFAAGGNGAQICGGNASDGISVIDLRPEIKEDLLDWDVPKGHWKVYALHLSRNMGYHRNYINMMDMRSCRVLIDAVYEPHYAHYKDDFGTTIAGFFSDEPELGNGHMYDFSKGFGDDLDYPWSAELEAALKERLGDDFAARLALLWETAADETATAHVRYAYMDALTRLVEKDFSYQMGEWCRGHGVQYIGHLIEDNNQHARTGSSLGHYFRGLAGQDMAGIDDIGGQVMPQMEDVDVSGQLFGNRIGEFYHYMLGKLGNSAAAIEPLKNGNSMCEIFGAYGWGEGVRLEKYLTDHFLVRGINHYVPHAFTPKAFPDPDCPPHFYAHGHNPQYRHFGALMAYMNRVCELISDGVHVAPVAVLYHGEGEWMGKCMVSHKIGHVLADAQIDYDYLPQDVFADTDKYRTRLENGCLKVNTQSYGALIVPAMPFVTPAFAAYVKLMDAAGVPVWFVDRCPEGVNGTVIGLDAVVAQVRRCGLQDVEICPEDNRIRYYRYIHADGTELYMLVNEGTQTYKGTFTVKNTGGCYCYNAWDNCLEPVELRPAGGLQDGNGCEISLTIEPLKSRIFVFDAALDGDGPGAGAEEISQYFKESLPGGGHDLEAQASLEFTGPWKRSICKSIDYPEFVSEKIIDLPDALTEEEPEFSGFVRYENNFNCQAAGGCRVVLEITDAHEGVEVFINGESQGIQIVPAYIYDITGALIDGENSVVIEVATTLEREMAKLPNMFGMKAEPKALSGITGEVKLYQIA